MTAIDSASDWRRTISDYSSVTTIHGMKQLILVNRFRKILWGVLLSCCSVLLVYQVNKKLQTLLKDPISTSITVEYPENLIFPAVAICNTNSYRLSYVKDNLYPMISDLYHAGIVDDNMNFDGHQDILESFKNISSLSFMQNAASNIDHMLLSCRNPDNSPCNSSSFEPISTGVGVCYAYNRDVQNPIRVHSAGVRSSLYLLINIEAYERTSGSSGTAGLKVVIFNQTGFPLVRSHSIDLAPGFKTNIAISRITRKRIDPSDGGYCTYTPAYKYLPNDTYNMDKCLVDKMISNVIEKCHCMPYFGPNTSAFCTVEQHFKCVIFNNDLPESGQACPTNCKVVQLSTSLSFSKYPDDFLTEALGPNATKALDQDYLVASETRERYQKEKVERNNRLIGYMRRADQLLNMYHLQPVMDNFINSYEQLKLILPCYSGFIKKFEDSLLFNPIWQMADHITNELLYDEKFIHILHPEISISNLVENLDSLVVDFDSEIKKARETLRETIHAFNELLNIFRESQFEAELSTDLNSYVDFMRAMNRFEKKEITKLDWSRKVREHERTMGEVRTSFLLPITQNLGRISSIIDENGQKYLGKIFLSVNDAKLRQLLTEMIFNSDDYRSQNCMDEMNDLADKLFLKWIDNSSYPTLFDTPIRINRLCPVESPFSLSAIVSEMESCINGQLMPNISQFQDKIAIIDDILSGPFDKIIMELTSYSWNHLHTNNFFDENILGIKIYYQDLTVEKFVQERTYDFWSFACDVGGTLGLCLGASLVTIFELLDFFVLRPLSSNMKNNENEKKAKSTRNDIISQTSDPPLYGGRPLFNETETRY